jgi:hypothetical protein
MSLIKNHQEQGIVENTSVESEETSVHEPQHPMLKWKGPQKEEKRDHLEEYNEVQPFEDSEGLIGMLKRRAKQVYAGAKAAKKAFKKGSKIEKKKQKKKKAVKAKAKAEKAKEEAEKAAGSDESDSDSE